MFLTLGLLGPLYTYNLTFPQLDHWWLNNSFQIWEVTIQINAKCKSNWLKFKYWIFFFHTRSVHYLLLLKCWQGPSPHIIERKYKRISCVWERYFFILFIYFFFISWRLITLQYCSGFCHTLKWISHGFTCVPHPDPPSDLPLHPITLGLPSAPGPSTCLMHPTWAGDLFHPW